MTTSEIMMVASTFCALLAALAAWRSARVTRLAAEGQLLAQVLTAYAESSMLRSLRTLRQWREDNGDDFATVYRNKLDANDPQFHEIDRARRHISHFFQNALTLYRSGCMGKKFIREVTRLSGIAIFFQIVEPLEHALNAGYGKEVFCELEQLAGRRKADFLIRAVQPEHDAEHG